MTKYWRPGTIQPMASIVSPAAPRIAVPVDPLAPDTTVYFDQSTGAQSPGAGGPMQASLIYYDNALSGLVANDVQTAIDLIDNQLDNITGASSGLDARVDVLETEMDAAQADILELESAGYLTDAPTDGQLYGRQSGLWSVVPPTDWANITGKPATFPPSAHTHLWADITDKPATFPPSAHGHAITDVTGLQAALDAKVPEAPSDGQLYGRKNAAWSIVPAPGIADAPSDGNYYTRRNAAWATLPAATETVAGIAEIATQTEANAGTDDARILTPLKLRNFTGTIAGPVTFTGNVTISKGSAVAQIISTDATNSALRYGSNNVVRAETGFEVANARWFININDAAGAYLGTPLSVLATRIGVNALPPAGITLHVQSTGDAWQQVQAATTIAGLALKNNTRTYDMRVSTSLLELWDNTASRRLLHIDATGAWVINPRSDGYGSLMVQGTTNPAILYFGHNTRQYHIENDGSSLVFKDDTAGGANRMWFDASGNCTITGPIYASNGLRGAEGDAGRLKCYNTGNYVTFQWTGTQLFARIDNGGAVVLLG